MKLTKAQFCKYVNKYKDMVDEEDQILKTLDCGIEWVPSKWITEYYNLISDMCELREDPFIGTDLDWFCFVTDFGRNEEMRKVYDPHKEWPWDINSPEILYDYIMREE